MITHARPPQWWNEATPDAITDAVREYLQTLAPTSTLSTNSLVEALYPAATARTLLAKAGRKIAFGVIQNATRTGALAGCYRRGEPRKGANGSIQRPYVWHRPFDVCPVCKGEGFLAPGGVGATYVKPAEAPIDAEPEDTDYLSAGLYNITDGTQVALARALIARRKAFALDPELPYLTVSLLDPAADAGDDFTVYPDETED